MPRVLSARLRWFKSTFTGIIVHLIFHHLNRSFDYSWCPSVSKPVCVSSISCETLHDFSCHCSVGEKCLMAPHKTGADFSQSFFFSSCDFACLISCILLLTVCVPTCSVLPSCFHLRQTSSCSSPLFTLYSVTLSS